jgi:hypothetical protein
MPYNESDLQMHSNLILVIEEKEPDNPGNIDNRIFIGFNSDNNCYYLRGRRCDVANSKNVPYAFQTESSHELANFLFFTVCGGPLHENKKIDVSLFNYNNITDWDLEDLTFEFFEENIDRDYEIIGYTNIEVYSTSMLLKWIKMIRAFYNDTV